VPRTLCRIVALFSLTAAIAGGGCAALPERNAVPLTLVDAAEVAGLTGVRGWGDERPTLEAFQASHLSVLRAKYRAKQARGEPLETNILAISGGGENGAFGAGLLVGWSEKGDRPSFDLVTGVSAGALIAPFAFLGSAYDRQLTEMFTRYGSDDIYEPSVLAGLLGGNAIASSAPLKRLIDKFITPRMMSEIAASCDAGRMLLVSTTNLDAERPVFWDFCKIARRGNRQAVELIRSILLASASIPGVFPPVKIKVVANGRQYEELHVDGGPTRQVFLSPNGFRFKEIDKAIGRKITRNLYIIRNGKIGPEFEETRDSLLAISQRSLYTTLKSQALGDLTRIHAKAVADGIGFYLAVIPDDFRAALPKPFDSAYMNALYRVGHQLGRERQPWSASPSNSGEYMNTDLAR
jgi:hypothetical protein